MTKLYKLLTGAFLAASFFTSSAMSDGLRIGVLADWSTIDTAGNEQERSLDGVGNVSEKTSTTFSEDVEIPGIFVEVGGSHSSGAGLSFGVEYTPGAASIGAKSRTDTDSATSSLDDDGVYTAKAEIDGLLRVYLEPTFAVNDMFSVFVKGGIGHTTVNTLETIDIGSDSSTYPDKDVFGKSIGFGVRATHSSGIFAKVEHMKTEWQNFELTSNSQIIEITELEQEGTRLAVGYQF